MRKVKFTICIITLVIIVFTSLSQLNSQGNPNMKSGFYLGPMSHYFLNVLESDSHNQWYKDLSYNMMQSYCGHFDTIEPSLPVGQRDGGFFESIGNYENQMRQVITNWRTIANDNSLIFEREKILRPAYGQRFTYQADINTTGWHNTKFPAYGYDTSETGQDTTEIWMGENVTSRYCKVGRDTSGFIVKGLYENCSQTNNLKRDPDDQNSSGWNRLYSDIKQQKYGMRWFVKPRMRIDSTYAKAHPNDTVVVIYTRRFDAKIIDSTSIICNNFLIRDEQGNKYYNGRYMERFLNTYLQTNDSANFLSVLSDSLAVGRVDGDTLTFHSKVDYQVKWLGKVDVWLDYVRIDDSWAHYLFTDTYENEISPTSTNIWKFHKRIKEEVEAFNSTNNGLGYFWVDEVQYPNLECIGEVNKLVKQYSGNRLSLLFITDPIAFMGWPAFRASNSSSTVDQANWDICINKAIDCGALSDIMVTQWFPFYYTVRYPDIFPNMPSNQHISNYIFPAQDYCDYTTNFDHGVQPAISWLVRQHKYYINKAKEKNLIYGVINQLNSDENNIDRNGTDWGIREPTNEEISLIMNTSLAYGAKVLLEFSYTTSLQNDTVQTFNRGLTTIGPDFTGKRVLNYYNQAKWDSVVRINKKLRRTGDYMYPVNNPNEHLVHDKTLTVNPVTYSGCSECGTANYDFVNDIKSLAPYLIGQTACNESNSGNTIYDDPNKRFWELGFFGISTSSSNQNNKSKYLFALNKRTYPVNNINTLGDIRRLSIKFNPSQLQGFNNWVIKNAVTDSVLFTFDKNTTDYYSAGEFQPGEGILFKIAPVMQEGGTFVCDELVTATTFNCNGTVNTGGYNLNIPATNGLTTISFAQNGTILGNGGTDFLIGGNNQVVLKGQGGGKWRGITVDSCLNVNIHNTKFEDIGDVQSSSLWALSIYNCPGATISYSDFILPPQAKGINVNNFAISDYNDVAIMNNNISVDNSTAAVFVGCSSRGFCNLFLMDNFITNGSSQSTFGILLSNVYSSYADRNTISGFEFGIKMMTTTLEMSDNYISSTGGNNTSILAASSSTINMGLIGNDFFGGNNNFSNYGANSRNMSLSNSIFEMNYGSNNLFVSDNFGNFN